VEIGEKRRKAAAARGGAKVLKNNLTCFVFIIGISFNS
jgi:hypothetical protein